MPAAPRDPPACASILAQLFALNRCKSNCCHALAIFCPLATWGSGWGLGEAGTARQSGEESRRNGQLGRDDARMAGRALGRGQHLCRCPGRNTWRWIQGW